MKIITAFFAAIAQVFRLVAEAVGVYEIEKQREGCMYSDNGDPESLASDYIEENQK